MVCLWDERDSRCHSLLKLFLTQEVVLSQCLYSHQTAVRQFIVMVPNTKQSLNRFTFLTYYLVCQAFKKCIELRSFRTFSNLLVLLLLVLLVLVLVLLLPVLVVVVVVLLLLVLVLVLLPVLVLVLLPVLVLVVLLVLLLVLVINNTLF